MSTTHGPKKLFRRRRSPRTVTVAGSIAVAAVAAVAAWFLFRSGGSATETASSPSVALTPSLSPRPTGVGKPRIKGVVVQVLNGTDRTRLAATTTQELAKVGYTMMPAGNSQSRPSVTLIAYQSKFLSDASFLQRVYFPQAVLEKSSVPFQSGADITVVLGPDVPG
jgi:hypothetical protein